MPVFHDLQVVGEFQVPSGVEEYLVALGRCLAVGTPYEHVTEVVVSLAAYVKDLGCCGFER